MAARMAPGGTSTISLGSEDPKACYSQREEDRAAKVDTPEATARFPQAPGGDTSISLGGDSSMEGAQGVGSRGPVGGVASVVLGSDDAKSMFAREGDGQAVLEVPEPCSRFPKPPGGDVSVSLGGDAPPQAAAVRGPVGGAATVVLGTDEGPERFQREQCGQGEADALVAAPRFQQAPGGTSSISLGPRDVADASHLGAVDTRGPVGGAASVVLGSDVASEAFAERQREREAVVDTPAAAPRFPQAPGGASSISLGAGAAVAEAPAGAAAAARPPVGGAATVVLGSDDSQGILSHYQEQRDAGVPTPDAAPRFSQAPGGSSTVCLGPSAEAAPEAVTVRGPVGGATSICLSGDGASPLASEVVATRGPVGGAASILLGTDDAKEVFDSLREERKAVVDTPDAAPRFQQAPGGTSSICLSSDGAPSVDGAAAAPRGPVGGVATVVLGSTDSKDVFSQRQEERGAPVETPDAAPRFPQAPGGNESASWAASGAEDAESSAAPRGPVGGATSILLGSEDSAAAFRSHEERREACVETPDAAPRFHQAPGGTSSVCLSNEGAPAAAVAVRGPVGGEATVALGTGAWEGAFQPPKELRGQGLETPDPAPRFQQAPGGDASICLDGAGSSDSSAGPAHAVRGEVGGRATVVLGIDDSEAILAQHREQHQSAVDTPVANPRFTQAPGGTASVALSGGVPDAVAGSGRCAPGGAATIVLGGDYPHDVLAKKLSANAFAMGTNQNCGNVLTEKPTTRLHQAPGGTATICLGSDDSASAPAERVSADKFAQGANQNSGNVLTDRSTTRLHQAPGGASTLCLGGDYPEDAPARTPSKGATKGRTGGKGCAQAPGGTATIVLGGDDTASASAERISANKFAQGSNQNCGNFLTDRSTTRLHQAPGGTSTVCLGGGSAEGASTRLPSKGAARGRRTGSVGRSPSPKRSPSKGAAKSRAASKERALDSAAACPHQAPGGTSTIHLGGSPPRTAVDRPSANSFATGSNQNCGNVLTDRPTTRLHQAPGGNSTLCLGGDAEGLGAKKVVGEAKKQEAAGNENMDTSNMVGAHADKDLVKPSAAKPLADKAVGGAAQGENARVVLG